MRSRVSALGGLIVGSVPGFLLPVVLIYRASPDIADLFLLAVSLSQFTTSLIASTLEAHLLAAIGRKGQEGAGVSRSDFRAVARWSFWVSLVAVAVVSPIVAWCYSAFSSHISMGGLLVEASPLLVVPIVAAQASKWSALLFTEGRLGSTYFGNFFRGSFTLVAAIIAPTALTLSVSYLVGEVARLAYYRHLSLRLMIESASGETLVPRFGSLGHQVGSMLVSQMAPVLIRSILSSGPAGVVAVAEVALRIFSGVNQVSMSAVTMRRVVELPRALKGRVGASGVRALGAVARRVLLESSALAGIASIGVAVVLIVFGEVFSSGLRAGLLWSIPLIASVPLVSANFWAVRALLLIEVVWPLMPISLFLLVVAAGGGTAFALVFGEMWSLVGLALSYVLGGMVSVGVLFRAFRARLFSPSAADV